MLSNEEPRFPRQQHVKKHIEVLAEKKEGETIYEWVERADLPPEQVPPDLLHKQSAEEVVPILPF